MARYLVRSLVQLLLTVAGVMTVTFFLMRAIPGDPALYMLGDYATTDAVASLRAKLGLDRPLLSQYAVFVRQTVSGDLGNSVVTGQPAMTEVASSLPWSTALTLSGMFIAIVIGVPLGIVSASRQGTWLDRTVMVSALLGISFPVFWIGLVAILVLSHWAGLFPTLGAGGGTGLWDDIHHLILPAVVLGVSVAAYIARLTRSAMLEVLGQDYIRVARAMGVSESRILYRLALRNALVPILAVIGVTFARSLGNAILIAVVFCRPGRGTPIMKAVLSRDYQLVQAGLLVLATAVVLVNTLFNVLYGIIDPRLRTR